MNALEALKALDPTTGMSEKERRLYHGYRKPTFTLFDRRDLEYGVLERGCRLPIYPDPDSIPWFAAGWGIDPTLGYQDMEREVQVESNRHEPCGCCGGSHVGSTDPRLCDPCFMRETVRSIRRTEERKRQRERRQASRDAAARSLTHLSPGRRQLCELSGMDFTSPEQVMAEGLGEW